MFDRRERSKDKIDELEYIVRNIPDMVLRVDIRGRITFVNAASILFFEKPPDLIIGQPIEDVVNEEGMVPVDFPLIQRVFKTRQAEIIEGEINSKSGLKKDIEIRILPEPDKNQRNPHLVLLVRDITMRKAAELKVVQAMKQAQESDMLKSAFLANMSHEIRTPLNAIVGFSQIIIDKDIDEEEQQRFFGYIQQNSNQLISLVNDIIDISKLESNQLVIRETMADLKLISAELKSIAETEKNNRDKDHLLVILEEEDLGSGALILADSYRLKQILINLLVNAIKFTPKGYVQFGYKLKDHDTLLFFVRDTGIGIPETRQQEVFQYFHQLENSLNRSNTGTGLGLAICKRLVELMDGSIWIESEPGKGSSFFFTIPYRIASPNA